MSHWFHRNVLKATTQVNFDMAMISSEPSAIKLCSDLKACRRRLLELLPDPGHTVEAIESVFSMYLALLHGLLFVPGENTPSKLRHNTLFKWTHSLLGNTPQLQNDAMFEAANMSCNVAFWFMKHAAMMAAKDDITMEEAKEVHTSLRKAAGIFKLVESEFGPKLTERQLEGGDLDPRVMSAYLTQCTAEAQEVTMARAMELKHNPSLISALANETYKLFSDAARVLEPLGDVTAQWIKYLRLKAAVYQAYVVVITEEVQNFHLLLEYRPHIDVSLTCEHDPKLQEYCVCPQNQRHYNSILDSHRALVCCPKLKPVCACLRRHATGRNRAVNTIVILVLCFVSGVFSE
ncbi:BRO1 domain-containing protein BROX-like isoform X2 [Periplaneta americana]|uniref:BRO1 domain-containing protein BROX-like isoform X2 n=1 Tax=Periplaneta americana TaxID=6978 RepID=UPI0037E9AE5E